MKKNLLETTLPRFPEFRELTLADRDAWEDLIADYPPYAHISFAEMIIWGEAFGYTRVSQLEGNIVVCYWILGDEEYSGLCLIGSHSVDESICTVFDWQKSTDRTPRLVHVPEFVMQEVKFPEMYKISPERGEDECLVEIKALTAFDNLSSYKKSKIRHLFANFDEDQVEVRSLNLGQKVNQEVLLDRIELWRDKGGVNQIAELEEEALTGAIRRAEELGYENACIYIGSELQGFILYQLPADSKFVIINYIRLSYEFPAMFEIVAYILAKWFEVQKIEYANIENDLGVSVLRNSKLNLGPTNFLRKYTIEPK